MESAPAIAVPFADGGLPGRTPPNKALGGTATSRRHAIRLQVKVAAGASRNAIDGWLGDTLKVRVTAPPERGKANAAVERLLAEVVGIPRAKAKVVSGLTSPRKVLELASVSESEVLCRLRRGSA